MIFTAVILFLWPPNYNYVSPALFPAAANIMAHSFPTRPEPTMATLQSEDVMIGEGVQEAEKPKKATAVRNVLLLHTLVMCVFGV